MTRYLLECEIPDLPMQDSARRRCQHLRALVEKMGGRVERLESGEPKTAAPVEPAPPAQPDEKPKKRTFRAGRTK